MPGPIEIIQAALRAEQQTSPVDAWLFHDFRRSDPLAYRILGLGKRSLTRRWFYCVPTSGTPRAVVSAVEPDALAGLAGERVVYRSWGELRDALVTTLRGYTRVAMQYSPYNQIPYVSRVDAGTVELVRDCGVEVVTSADLVQRCEAVWTAEQYASHCRAARILGDAVDATFRFIAQQVDGGHTVTEVAAQRLLLDYFDTRGVETSKPPIVAVDAHSANPHFEPTPASTLPIRPGSFVLLDLWAKEPDSVYADITWTGYVGTTVPDEYRRVFDVVRAGRDAAIERVRAAVRAGDPICGADVDDAARAVIAAAGYGEYFVHRTGHSIGIEVHGNGANIDGFENPDHRQLLPHTCFSIEPGIYLPGRFGIRSEVDVYLSGSDAEVTGPPAQTAVVPILAMPTPTTEES